MKTIDDLIAVVTIGCPSGHRALSVYPVRREGKCKTAAYLVLDDALATGWFHITEVSETINDNSSPIFLLDGEELVGAKQTGDHGLHRDWAVIDLPAAPGRVSQSWPPPDAIGVPCRGVCLAIGPE